MDPAMTVFAREELLSRSDPTGTSPVREFIRRHYRHFNAAVVRDAAEAYERHLAAGGKMFPTLAGP
jgi:deoxyhypusine synthase